MANNELLNLNVGLPDIEVSEELTAAFEADERRVRELVGNETDPESNSGKIRSLTERSVISADEQIWLELEPLAEAGKPLSRPERQRAMGLNDRVFEAWAQAYGVDQEQGSVEEREISNGFRQIEFSHSSPTGLTLTKVYSYMPGHDPEADPLPDASLAYTSRRPQIPIMAELVTFDPN